MNQYSGFDLYCRVELPLTVKDPYTIPENLRARHLALEVCSKSHAVSLVRLWHSRLPVVQNAPWKYAFKMSLDGVTFAVALWNNPSARMLPGHWIELRRMACAADAPKYTASRFLSLMVKWFNNNAPEHEKCISYQDTAVHLGTIYKAANWTAEYTSKARIRDRSKSRVGTNRLYRSNINGVIVDSSPKVRWSCLLKENQCIHRL